MKNMDFVTCFFVLMQKGGNLHNVKLEIRKLPQQLAYNAKIYEYSTQFQKKCRLIINAYFFRFLYCYCGNHIFLTCLSHCPQLIQ